MQLQKISMYRKSNHNRALIEQLSMKKLIGNPPNKNTPQRNWNSPNLTNVYPSQPPTPPLTGDKKLKCESNTKTSYSTLFDITINK